MVRFNDQTGFTQSNKKLRKPALCAINQGIASITEASKGWICGLPCYVARPNLLNDYS
jgi:hypothetical protein